MEMSIAALSVDMHNSQTAQQIGLSTLKMAMDSQSQAVMDLLPAMTGSLDSAVGTKIDIMA